MEIEKNKFFYFAKIQNSNVVEPLIKKLGEIGIQINQIVPAQASKFARNGDYIITLDPPDNPIKLIIGKVEKSETKQPQREGDGQIDFVKFNPVLTTDFKPYSKNFT